MPNYRRLASLPALVVVVALAAACSSGAAPSASAPSSDAPPSAPASPDAQPSSAGGALVTLEVTGGHCLEGGCGSTITINADGTAHQTVPEEKDLGSVPANLLDALVVEVEQADFEAILSRPFTDTCPIAFDGQQFTYTFSVGGESVKIDSCAVVVDPADPLFVAVDAAIASVNPA